MKRPLAPTITLVIAAMLGVAVLVGAVVVGAVLVGAVAMGALAGGIERTDPASPSPDRPPATAGIPPPPAGAIRLSVEDVVDGDTLRARALDPGILEVGASTRVRLIGIDTPEVHPELQCGGREAAERLAALLPEGSTVWAAPDAELRDRYDRALLYVWAEDGGFVNHALVADGLATTMVIAPNDAHAPLLARAEQDAREAGVGSWASCGW
ncbi:thermonuclease family protein [Microbacterium sp. Marseille-Q6648]|uniref:thermonuclease family protein n=1 Tax=Microbacterium sp. Marseille-Q6648 TaxID=2937991 RepID=UPI00203CA342|nr:thermonuclease family protein [Microbacterium sp. Marseille-Q6648]